MKVLDSLKKGMLFMRFQNACYKRLYEKKGIFINMTRTKGAKGNEDN